MIYAETKVVAYVIIEKMGIYCGIYDVESVPDGKYDPTQFSVTSIIVAHRYKVVCRITVSQFLIILIRLERLCRFAWVKGNFCL